MIRVIALSAAGAAMLLAAPALAQPGGSTPPPSGSVPSGPQNMENTGDTASSSAYEQLRRMQDEAARHRADAAAHSKYGQAVAAKPSEVVARAAVYDLAGETVGTIESVDPDGAVVSTAVGKVKVPLAAFGKNKQGLLVGVSKKEFEAQVTKAYAAPAG